MPRRTQIMQKVPWTGGINTSVDPGVLNSNDLVQADNVEFTVNGTRLKRQGRDYFDTAIPASASRSSSGTTRTVVFASSVGIVGPPVDDIIAVGESITISGAGSASYNGTFTVASVSTTTITFTGVGSLTEGSTADTGMTVTRNYDIIGLHDLWYYDTGNSVKAQEVVALTSQGLLFKYDANGKRTIIPMSGTGATAFASNPSRADLRTYNNKLIFCTDGAGNVPKYYDPNGTLEWKDVVGAPDGEFCMEHLGRLFMNDKADPDKLHFCETYDDTLWQGNGDSGALFLGAGDGDHVGISCIKPPFKGRLFVSKGQKEYQIVGETPEEFFVQEMTNGVGAVSHRSAVSVDYEDVYHISRRGIHSISTTDQFGDFAGSYLSREIQPTFNEWTPGKLNLSQGVYLSNKNSVAWIVAEKGQTKPNAVWLFNPTIQSNEGAPGVWYRWPGVNAQSIATYNSSGTQKVMFGNNAGRLLLSDNGDYTDLTNTAITWRVKTGIVYPDNNPQTLKAFKKFGLLYKPKGAFNFTAYFSVDNGDPQVLVFEQDAGGDLLGSEFVLGSSILGANAQLAPFMKDVSGHGRGCTIEIFQTGTEAQIELYGYIIEYEPMDVADAIDT